MKKIEKFILPALVVFLVGIVYFTYFAPTDKLGDFSKFGVSEINQRINVLIIKESKVSKNANGEIISFSVKDKNNIVKRISLHEPISSTILNAEIVELLGHMHGNDFICAGVEVIK